MDRNTYRMCEDSELINEAAFRPTVELAIVLGERLADAEVVWTERLEEAKQRAADFEIDANQLDDKVYMLRAELTKAEQTVADMAAELARLKETAK